MRILHVITSLRIGGAETLVSHILPLMRAKGHDVELAIFDRTPSHLLSQLHEQEIKIHAFGQGKAAMYSPLHIPRLHRLMKSFDIVHTHNTSAQLFSGIAAPEGPVLLTTEHNTDNRRRHHPILKPVDRWMYDRYDYIIACSEAVSRKLREYLPERLTGKLSLIPNGIPIPENPLHSAAPKKPLSEKCDILMIAAFRPQKDHLTAIRALQLMPPHVRLFFAGDGELRHKMEVEVEKLRLTSRVSFLGNVNNATELLQKSDIALLSTHYEGLSLAIIESMASGVPLIASDVEGVREICGGAAILTAESDPAAIAEAVNLLIQAPSLAEKVSQACRKRALDFDINITADRYLRLYKNLLARESRF